MRSRRDPKLSAAGNAPSFARGKLPPVTLDLPVDLHNSRPDLRIDGGGISARTCRAMVAMTNRPARFAVFFFPAPDIDPLSQARDAPIITIRKPRHSVRAYVSAFNDYVRKGPATTATVRSSKPSIRHLHDLELPASACRDRLRQPLVLAARAQTSMPGTSRTRWKINPKP